MRPIIRFFMYFVHETPTTIGSSGKVVLGNKVAVANTMFNVSSGSIHVGDYTVFGQNVMVITGRHRFENGQRAGLELVKTTPAWGGGDIEVPESGYDISIGSGCWIASGAIISGGVVIGDHVIVAAGAVVTRDLPDHAIAAGVPARVTGDTRELSK